MFENAALPQRRGLLIFADANPLADDILRLLDAGVGIVREFGVEESTARKDRQGDQIEAALTGN